MIHPRNFQLFVIDPVLLKLQLYSREASMLLLGTAITESGLIHLDQITRPGDLTLGPGLGFYQIERVTHSDIWDNYLDFQKVLGLRVRSLAAPGLDSDEQLVMNMAYSTAIARVIYLRVPAPLPHHSDLRKQAEYWKEHYKTVRGKGSPEDYIERAGIYLRQIVD